jgi:endonuclease YncB( thermonuclease family)
MSDVVRFHPSRNFHPAPAARLHQILPIRWLPLALFMIAAAAISFAGKQSAIAPAKASAFASGPFQLCRYASQQNCVVDGDTIRYGGEKIRLADLNAPEMSRAQCAGEYALGERTTHRLVELMNAGPFTITPVGGRDADNYGRKLRVIARDGRSVSDTLIAEGLARPWNGARQSWCG